MSIPRHPLAGYVVALEGPPELVSTQLRLLPISSKILVLPSLQYYLGDEVSQEKPFNAQELICRYHAAALARHAEALEFLRPSTSVDETRLVFTQGGTLSAHVSCLSAIMEHVTDGNIEEAYATFIRLASNGHARLSSARPSFYGAEKSPLSSRETEASPEPATSSEEQMQQRLSWRAYDAAGGETIEDPMIRAMKAADALDRETEFLQQSWTPEVDLTVKLVDILPSKKRPRSTAAVRTSDAPRVPRSPSPRRQMEPSAKPVPDTSLDGTLRTQPSSAASQRPLLRIHIPSSPIARTGEVATNGAQPKGHHPQTPTLDTLNHMSPQIADLSASPTHVPAPDGKILEQTTLSSPEIDSLSPSKESYSGERANSQVTRSEEETFEALLPLLEDLAVFFAPETPEGLHDFVFQRLSEGYGSPWLSKSPDKAPKYGSFQDERPLAAKDKRRIERGRLEDEVPAGIATRPQKEPDHGPPTLNHSSDSIHHDTSAAVPRLNTRLCSISVGEEAAVSVQNSLRSFLGSRLPLQDRRFSATDGVNISSDTGLWRPLECDAQVLSLGGERRLDLILAVGSEGGLSKGRASELVGQIEQLGRKASGVSRSGRLDIRYLIASAMQAFTAQPLTKQTQSNPFADRALLAALIIPHLETYLATHPDVRFLIIEYPSEHLATVLALQAIIGAEAMKVVGIINNDISAPQNSQSGPDGVRRISEGFRSLSCSSSSVAGAPIGPYSFSKANVLLASSATGAETDAFVAAIHESLISVSDDYMPERSAHEYPAPRSPSPKTSASLTDSTRSPGTISPPKKEMTSRFSFSTLITPPSSPSPSSPTESPSPPTHAHRRITPGWMHPHGSQQRATSTTNRAPRPLTAYTDTSTAQGSVQWAEVNYAPESRPPSAPTTTSAAITDLSAGQSKLNNPRSQRHRKRDSSPLSPRAIPSSSKKPTSASSTMPISNKPAVPAHADDDEDGSESDTELAREARRLLPLYLRRREEIERGRSSKAMRWLGLELEFNGI